MVSICLAFAWIWFVLGVVSGAGLGLGFHRPGFAGGYGSWRRRLMRLGHIAFFGTGFLVLALGLTAAALPPDHLPPRVFRGLGWLMIAGAVLMPTVCFLASWRKNFRWLFALPVAALGGAVVGFTRLLLRSGVIELLGKAG